MPRVNNINGVNVPLTAEEEAAQDVIDEAWEAGTEARHAIDTREGELEGKLVDDSITFTELKELMRFRG